MGGRWLMHVGAYRRPDGRDMAVARRAPVRGDYTRFHWSLSVVVKRGPRAAIGATRDEF